MSIWPAIIYLITVTIGTAMAINKHPSSTVWTLVVRAFILAVLWWGGFFNALFGH